MPRRGNRGSSVIILGATGLFLLALGCSPRKEPAAAPAPGAAPAPAGWKPEMLSIRTPEQPLLRAGVPVTLAVEARPALPEGTSVTWTFVSPAEHFSRQSQGPRLEVVFGAGGTYAAHAEVGVTASPVIELRTYRVALVGPDGRPVLEARDACFSRESFDHEGRLRPQAVLGSGDRLQVLVEDPHPGAPATVGLRSRPTDPPLTLPLEGSSERRLSRPFVGSNDRDDALAGIGSVLLASPGDRIEIDYRGPAGEVRVGPSVIHEIPVEIIAAGRGLPDTRQIEKAVDARLSWANQIWEPWGRRFTRGRLVRLEEIRGLAVIRGRAAGTDSEGRSSRLGLRIDGTPFFVPGAWRQDGAPLTPRATARALVEKGRGTYSMDVIEGLLAGDREAVVLRIRRPGGLPATLEPLPTGNDVSQAITPIPIGGLEGVEVSPTPGSLSLEETALLASGGAPESRGLRIFVALRLRALEGSPAFKLYPQGLLPPALGSSAALSLGLFEGEGRFPYALGRVLGALLLPPGVRPGPEDSLFADPLSETPGVDGHKRVSAATAAAIAARGRGLASQK